MKKTKISEMTPEQASDELVMLELKNLIQKARRADQKAAGACTWEINCGQHHVGMIMGFEPLSKHIVKRNKLVLNSTNWGNEYEIYAISPGEYGYSK